MQTLELKAPYLQKRNKLVIVCSKGSLDMAYPPLMLATSGAAMGMEVHLYLTFCHLDPPPRPQYIVPASKMGPISDYQYCRLKFDNNNYLFFL